MRQLVVLDKKKHRNYRLLKHDLSHSKNLHICPILLSEFISVSRTSPIIFTKSKETGKLESCALLGVTPGENLFWQEGRWQGDYIPVSIRSHPFYLRYKKDDLSNAYVCVESSLLCASKDSSQGVALFEHNGEPSKHLLAAQRELENIHLKKLQTWKFVESLQKFDLLKEQEINIDLPGETKHKLKGVYCISEDKVRKLGATEFLKLRDIGCLPFIYAHLFSLLQSSNLRALHKKNYSKVLH
ncbi:SapC family protein [Microbulbifer sp. JMSA004]|uniref:SapC family protein n=1 Tax=unclassified Microbulbifer TaxID=2619833 RepID=UPI0024AE2AC5|nr:SapC family protein [Microbulbifer sp. VAAF005]WHI44530.1 SapC family protein [Microbulbifer sp. VAAF005]